MSKVERFWVVPLLMLFMMHGLLYYLYPEQHYASGEGASGPLSYLKYLFLFAALPALMPLRTSWNGVAWFVVGGSVITLTLILQVYWVNEKNFLLLQFALAVLGYFFAPLLIDYYSSKQRVLNSVQLVLGITLTSMVGELFFGSFADFSRAGFRAIGPFVNPNNTGIVVALFAAIYHVRQERIWLNLFNGLIFAVVLIMSGSKTALIMYLVVVLVVLPNFWRSVVLVVLPVTLLANADLVSDLLAQIELREVSLDSASVRSGGFSMVLGMLGEMPLEQLLFGFSNQSQIDNAYLDLWGFGGIFLVISFVGIQVAAIFVCFLQRQRLLLLLLHILFFLAMMTTNVPRLWPTAYMYWALVGISFLRVTHCRSTPRIQPISHKLIKA